MQTTEEMLDRANRELKSLPIDIEPLDKVFYIFAVKVNTQDGNIRRMLSKGKVYHLLKGFEVGDETITVSKNRYKRPLYDLYVGVDGTKPHVSFSAIVGENGSGKSSLVEFELRLLNNFAASLFGEYSKETGWEHLHYINDVYGELFFLYDKTIYRLIESNRQVRLLYYDDFEDTPKQYVYHSFTGCEKELYRQDGTGEPYIGYGNTKRKEILKNFFYTMVLNQSIYAYNTRDYCKECNEDEYEVKVRGCKKTDKDGREIKYSIEDRNWLKGLFHKNDGYQIPIVLSPYRSKGNIDINKENDLAYERLITLLVHSGETFRTINSHLRVGRFVLNKKHKKYDLDYLHENIGYSQFTDAEFERMKTVLLGTWISTLQIKIPIRVGFYTALAKNYLVTKTLKIAATYSEYETYRKKYIVDGNAFDENDFKELVKQTIANRSHVSTKLYRTFAYLLWDIYDIGGDHFTIPIDDVHQRWADAKPNKVLSPIPGTATLALQAAIPPPFFDMSIQALELNTHEVVPIETLSSGEKQMAYTISSILYHLNNLDSVGSDSSTKIRVQYPYIHIVLEEVELYFHPQLQKEFVRSLIDGLRQMNFNTIKWIDIRIVTHSPFVLSDIPTENVLTLRKERKDTESIDSFGANIHEMLRNTFFLKNGTMGDYASWLIKRITRCLCVHRWLNGIEPPPTFFPSLKGELPEEYVFLKDFESLVEVQMLNRNAFYEVYSNEKLLMWINQIAEPVVRRVLLDDYHRTFPDDKEEYKKSVETMIRSLQADLDVLNYREDVEVKHRPIH